MPRHRRHCTGTSVKRRSGLRVRAPQAGSEKTEHWSWHTHHRMEGGRREGSWNIRNAATGRKRSVRQLSPAASRASRARRDRRESEPTGSSRAAAGQVGNRLGAIRHAFGCTGRGNLSPSLAQPNGLAHAREKLLFAVIVPPPPAAIKLQKIRASALGQGAPFLRDLLERMCGLPFRHGKALSGRCSRCGLVSGARASNNRLLTVVRSAGRRNESPHPS